MRGAGRFSVQSSVDGGAHHRAGCSWPRAYFMKVSREDDGRTLAGSQRLAAPAKTRPRWPNVQDHQERRRGADLSG